MSDPVKTIRTIPLTTEELNWCTFEKEQQRSHEWRNNLITFAFFIIFLFVGFTGCVVIMVNNWSQNKIREEADLERYRISHSPIIYKR